MAAETKDAHESMAQILASGNCDLLLYPQQTHAAASYSVFSIPTASSSSSSPSSLLWPSTFINIQNTLPFHECFNKPVVFRAKPLPSNTSLLYTITRKNNSSTIIDAEMPVEFINMETSYLTPYLSRCLTYVIPLQRFIDKINFSLENVCYTTIKKITPASELKQYQIIELQMDISSIQNLHFENDDIIPEITLQNRLPLCCSSSSQLRHPKKQSHTQRRPKFVSWSFNK